MTRLPTHAAAALGVAAMLAGCVPPPPAPTATTSLEATQGAANSQPGPRTVPGRAIPIPNDTVSPPLATLIGAPYRAPAWNLNPKDNAGWKEGIAKFAAAAAAAQPALRERLGVTMRTATIGGIPCFVIEPKVIPAANRNRILINAHGGGYVYGPGESGTQEATLMAAFGGFRVIEFDYRMPPDAPYPAAMDDAMAVYRAVLKTTPPRRIAIFGTSTGGGMTLAMILRAKTEGLPMPAAIAPGTPWSDLTETGDTYKTNEWLDNVLVSYSGYLGRAALLYANGHDLKDPQLSPIYGDFHGFPPTFLTSGTRDLFLSNTVRTERKLRDAGVPVELNVFEGMSHAQYSFDANAPETKAAFTDIAAFLDRHMAR